MVNRPIDTRSSECSAPAATTRRDILAAGLGFGAAALAGAPAFGQAPPASAPGYTAATLGWDDAARVYTLPALPYAPAALEPHIDAQTMQLHHDMHHAGYVRGLNAAIEALAAVRSGSRRQEEIQHWSRQLAFHGSGHFLHVVFWNCMTPETTRPSGRLGSMIDRDFGGYEGFAAHFEAAAVSVEGSGWAILVYEPLAEQLLVMQAEKHQNLTAWGVVPLVAVDVWEHAYYLKYQNKRKDYVSAFMNVINWPWAERVLEHVTPRA